MNITQQIRKLLPLMALFFNLSVEAQTLRVPETLQWRREKNDSIALPAFEPSNFCLEEHSSNGNFEPWYYRRFETSNATKELVLQIIEDEPLPNFEGRTSVRSEEIAMEWHVQYEKGVPITYVRFMPIYLKDGVPMRLNKFELIFTEGRSIQNSAKSGKKAFATSSVLETGSFYKIRIGSDGIYRIDADFIRELGLNPENIELNRVQIFGNGGGELSEIIGEPRTDDLAECAVEIIDQNANNLWDNGDYVLFYGKGPHTWKYDPQTRTYDRKLHTYDDYAYYFLRFGHSTGLRIGSRGSGQGQNYQKNIDRYDLLLAREQDDKSLTKSGRIWVGDEFSNDQPKNFEHELPGFGSNDTIWMTTTLLARSLQNSNMLIFANDRLVHNQFFFRVNGEYTSNFSTEPMVHTAAIVPGGSNLRLRFQYNRPMSTSVAWIDRYILQGKTRLQQNGPQWRISSSEATLYSDCRFELTGNFRQIWDVSDPSKPFKQSFWTENNTHYFITASAGPLKWFLAFDESQFLQPEFVSRIENQNLHSIKQADYIIISHSSLLREAERLADFHRKQRNLNVVIVRPDHIFNEFSSGAQDVTAMRDFVKMVYDRSADAGKPLQYLLMFGDASYDYKNKTNGNTNLVPTYQSYNSHDPVVTHCSDDYFGILDDNEGYWGEGAMEGIDIGIGRLPVKNTTEARIVIDKIIRYEQPETRGDWRNRIVFVADDEDGNMFVRDCEDIAAIVERDHNAYNVQKIYLDAYPQVSFGSGDKYPQVNQAIDEALDRGILIFNYIGHGGGQGLALERIITREQIQSWGNRMNMPLFVTATCELSRFDDPSQDSPGELMLYNENGGAIALVTTTRVVYTNVNKNLNVALFNQNLLLRRGIRYPALGEVYMDTKNNSLRDINQRNFILLGDPAMILAYPREELVTLKINGKDPGIDTLKALSKVSIEGQVLNRQGQPMQDFNGVLSTTVFDKALTYETLANDRTSFRQQYQMQINALFRGNASVNNGRFAFDFVVPKDITYNYGNGKLSFYAFNEGTDGHGYNTSFVVGGSADSAAIDNSGPEVELYLNDETWVTGGITGTTPLLLAKISDEHGVNMVGNGIGRDISAVIDKGTDREQMLVLNEFYQSKLDSYQEGEIRYRLNQLDPGKHTLELKVWDVYNNSSTALTEFEVVQDEKPVISNLLNYPNPFSTSTEFHFDHNQAGRTLDVQLKVMTISGRVVYSAQERLESTKTHFSGFTWNGTDIYGDVLAKGVYIYRLELRNESGDKSQELQKLFIIR